MDTQLSGILNRSGNGIDFATLKKPDESNGYLAGRNVTKNSVELLENELGKSLPGFTSLSQLNAADFTPQAVADRILAFVETSIRQRAGSDLEAQSMLQQAREGITQGFAEAREILSSMPQMTDEINAQIDTTESLIFQGLDNLQNEHLDAPQQQQINQLVSESASLSSQFKQSSQASIEIITQQGDRVEVSYSAFIQSASKQSYTQEKLSGEQQGYSSAFDFSSTSSAAFEFSVQGELDAGEQQAINELLYKVGDLAGQFFNGDVQAAFNSAMELGIDSKELKSYALDFQQSTYIEVVQTYQRTEEMVNPVKSLPDPGPAIDVLSQLRQLTEQAKESALIEQPENKIKSLLADMLDSLSQEMDSSVYNYIKNVI